MPRPLLCYLLAIFLLTACAARPTPVAVAPLSGLPQGTGDYPWWNDTVFYEIFVRSFYDSNGDGVGDLNGLTEKLDYLNDGNPATSQDLGVTGLWLMPIHPSPSYHGYDVTDYYTINPQYGTLDDFKRLLEAAHQRGMRVIIDLVLNHTSSQHPWFRAASDPQSDYRDWYLWTESEPSGSGWRASPNGYYFGIFDVGMPDLNYANPAVTEQMYDVARFWLQDVGVDGFRLDAAKHLIEQGSIQTNSDATHAWFKEFRPYYKGLNDQALTVGEVWEGDVTVGKYLAGNELDLAFSFDLAQALVTSARIGSADQAARLLARDIRLFRPGQFAVFLTNHDQARVMSQLADNANKAKVAASLLLTSPGVSFIYYGEEIGMLGKKPDELIRTPMQWDAQAHGGFTTGIPWETPSDDYAQKNVGAQTTDSASLLAHYRTLIALRNNHAALRIGDYLPVQTCTSNVIAFLRHTQSPAPQETILVAINLGAEPAPNCNYSLADGPLSGTYQAVSLLPTSQTRQTPIHLTANPVGGMDAYQPQPELPPYTALILQLLPAP